MPAEPPLVRLDEDTLKQIAQITHAEYFYAGTAVDLRKIYENLNSKLVLERKETEISALFAARHFNFQSPNLEFIPLFFFACGLGFLYQRTHRAIRSILMHMMLNVCTLVMLALSLPSS